MSSWHRCLASRWNFNTSILRGASYDLAHVRLRHPLRPICWRSLIDYCGCAAERLVKLSGVQDATVLQHANERFNQNTISLGHAECIKCNLRGFLRTFIWVH